MFRRFAVRLMAASVLVPAAACASGSDTASGPGPGDGIRIASFDFAESVLLAEMYAQVVESAGVPVVRLGTIGPREIVAPAQQLGRIDLVPEYLGTALQYAGADETIADTDEGLAALRERLAAKDLLVLDAAPAQDKNVFAITSETAARTHAETLSDLRFIEHVMLFGGTAECPDRPLCLAGLESVYGLRFAGFVPQPSLTFTAEALRRGEIDIGLMFSTAAELVAFDLFVLDDDLGLQPAENVVPVLRADTVDTWGTEFTDALNAMSAALTTRELRFLNVHVMNETPVEVVARDWLSSKGLVD